ncbi:uncharacterized protein LOC128040372 [Gossypium raimondii]|uniref:uncharacterized protein LOC128040372 n=1 Tax=Gossypium raimondii TaxID=29730 RepID=UPI00227C74AC|nr:uncharacterized protein LOC128040372 [Gossypium raimondii]
MSPLPTTTESSRFSSFLLFSDESSSLINISWEVLSLFSSIITGSRIKLFSWKLELESLRLDLQSQYICNYLVARPQYPVSSNSTTLSGGLSIILVCYWMDEFWETHYGV